MDAKRTHKNSVFTSLFGTPNKMLDLYNTLSGADYPPDTEIKITTLSDVLFLDQQNDLSFIVDGKIIILLEHQATISDNLPLRLLMYLGRVYESIVDDKKIYARSLIKLPRPEFIVLYNGKALYPDEKILKLSTAFHKVETASAGGNVELEVKVININKNRNHPVLQRNEDLNGYAIFIAEVNKNLETMNLNEAITKAVKDCIGRNILVDFLKENASEVVNMLFAAYNKEDYGAVMRDEGRQEGEQVGFFKAIKKLLLKKSPAEVAELYELPLEQVESLAVSASEEAT